MLKQIITLFLAVLCCSNLGAAEDSDRSLDTDTVQQANAGITGEPFFKPQGFTFYIYAGDFQSADEAQFEGIRAEYALGLGFSAELKRYPNLALDLELLSVNREFDTPVSAPLFATIDNDTAAETTAFLAGARIFYPATSSFRAYAAAGLGLFRTKMIVHGSTFGLPGSLEDTESSMNIYYGAGIRYMFSQWGLGVDYRHFNLDGSFNSFNISDADLSGDLFVLSLNYSF